MKYTAAAFEILWCTANITLKNNCLIKHTKHSKENVFAPFFLILISSMLTFNSYCQKPVLSDEEVVSETVIKEIDEVFQSQDFLKKKNKNFFDVKGTMTVDIGVVENGKVATFFKVESSITNTDFINFMSDYILDHKFKFKLHKKQRYKIRYNINFN